MRTIGIPRMSVRRIPIDIIVAFSLLIFSRSSTLKHASAEPSAPSTDPYSPSTDSISFMMPEAGRCREIQPIRTILITSQPIARVPVLLEFKRFSSHLFDPINNNKVGRSFLRCSLSSLKALCNQILLSDFGDDRRLSNSDFREGSLNFRDGSLILGDDRPTGRANKCTDATPFGVFVRQQAKFTLQ